MKKLSYVIFVIFILSLSISVHAIDPGWERWIGASDKNEEANSVIVTPKGNYIVAGSVKPSELGGKDMFIMSVSTAGQAIWEKIYGSEYDDFGLMAQPTIDGGYVLVGEKGTGDERGGEIYLVKTDSKGDSIWTRTHGAEDYYFFTANAIRPTLDSGFIILGTNDRFTNAYYDVYLIKVDKNGWYQWDQHYGGEGNDFGNSVEITKDGGYLITGSITTQDKGIEMYVIKTDAKGDTIWTRTMGHDATDIALSAKETGDGYIICGEVNMMSDVMKSNGVLVKLDKKGNTVWYREFGGDANDGFQAMLVTKDNGFICAGYTNSFSDGKKDMYLVRTDSAGNELWYKKFGASGTDYATSIAETKDGYIIAGTFTWPATGKTDIYLVKTDFNGNSKKE